MGPFLCPDSTDTPPAPLVLPSGPMSPFLVWSLAACRLPLVPLVPPPQDLTLDPQVDPTGHPMSNPAIYIAPRGTTPHVRPRYTVSDHPEICFGIIPAVPEYMARSLAAVFRISHTPYGFRNSEIQNRKPATPEIMVRLSGPLPSILVS